VGKRYGHVAALEDVSFTTAAGGRTAIVGPSGSGKTTLLRIISGFEAPDAGGLVALDGKILAGPRVFAPAHRRDIGFVSQDGALFPHLTVADNIGFGLGRDIVGRSERIAQLMKQVELDAAMRDRRPHELSGGQQQRVALARALARKPKLMLLDEPFSALDTGLRDAMRRLVANALRAAGVTTILVTHDQSEALSFADQLVVLRAGRVAQAGAPRDLYLKPADPDTARFLGEAIIAPAEIEGGWATCFLGRAPADASCSGARLVMLRPEQIALTRNPPADAGAARAVVTEVEYGGGVSIMSLLIVRQMRIEGAGEKPPPVVQIKALSNDLPAVGETVGVSINGSAHIFSAP